MTAPHPLRVCFITTGLGAGGAEMMLCRLIGGMDRTRFNSSVISLTEGGRHVDTLAELGVPVSSLAIPAGRPTLSGVIRLIKLVRRLDPDLLVGWMYHGNLAALLARMVLFRRVPVLWNVRQSLYSLGHEKRGSAAVIRMLGPLSRFVSSIAYNSKLSVRQHETVGFRNDKTVLIPNGIDTSVFAPSDAARRNVRAELGIPGEALLVGRFGRFTSMKDYPSFLEAAAMLRRQFPGAHFLLVGTGVDRANAELASRIAVLGLEDVVHLLGERRDMPRLTAALDVAVSSSAFAEGFPNVMGEAMACGVPCVATDIGDSTWLIGPAGWIVAAGQPQALADACAQILAMPPSERKALGMAGRQRIEKDFSLPAAVRRYEELFIQHAAEPSAASHEMPCAV